MMNWLRKPLLHFVLIGGLLFLASKLLEAPPGPPIIEISKDDLETLREQWRAQTGRSTTQLELERLVEQQVDDELLFREALAMGWHQTDPVVHRRLIRNMRFLLEESDEDDQALLLRAFEMGMDRTDIVVRRRLVERMKLAIASMARTDEVDDAELQAYRDEHRDLFTRAPRIRFTQVPLSRDRRPETLLEDAQALGRRLRAESISTEESTTLGDPLLLGRHQPSTSQREIAARFGPAFSESVMQLETGVWSEPVVSSYGAHLVWVHERVPSRLPPLEEIRDSVHARWLAEREREQIRQVLAELRQGVEVRIAPDA